ncbi:MAG: hypothetical protein Q4A31_09115 [Corynebacterium sp.]|uniref:hypothetical protein n=1 Tax=Corynebacterium sp. TaxID=1720 RepID=UPI0026DC1C0C|nr:hypothetical protein [Corynebacterium sp.]MDO4762063.1 hypothetical protein [Corynebacterium sp.]
MRRLRWIDPLIAAFVTIVVFGIMLAIVFLDRSPGGIGEATMWLTGFFIAAMIPVFVLSFVRSALNARPLMVYLVGGVVLALGLAAYSLSLDGQQLHPEPVQFMAIAVIVVSILVGIAVEIVTRPPKKR